MEPSRRTHPRRAAGPRHLRWVHPAVKPARAHPRRTQPEDVGILDVTVRRNDYGGQRESFEDAVRVEGLEGGPFPGVFIRAPRVLFVGAGATPFAWRGKEVVGVRAGAVWGLTFHPELSGDPRIHRQFLEAAARKR